MKTRLLKPYASYIARQVDRIRHNAIKDQRFWFDKLVHEAEDTAFGRAHHFSNIDNISAYQAAVPPRDYEEAKTYFDQIKSGAQHITWPGTPKYLAKTSGTTSGTKYIPITGASLPNHIGSARMALMNYIASRRDSRIFDGKLMFLSGSPTLHTVGGIKCGRLSGIVNHEIPFWLKGNQLPSYATNCIEDWEEKVDQIVIETQAADLRVISGIPPWVQMYFERLLEKTGKTTVGEVFPNLSLFVYGGVDYAPYRKPIENLLGRPIDTLETYPASEGFIAFQDDSEAEGLLLNTNAGIFFEFIPLQEIGAFQPSRLTIEEVELGVDYALLLTSNAGLWSYKIGDTVRFVSLDPYRIIVSGRVKHFISAFGEHVIGKEIETAILRAQDKFEEVSVREFTVAPQVTPPEGGKPYHEWLIEYESAPHFPKEFARAIEAELCTQNIYYKDLIDGAILRPLVIRPLVPDAFRTWMKSRGKLGGQNKVPRLSNDRKIADALYKLDLVQG